MRAINSITAIRSRKNLRATEAKDGKAKLNLDVTGDITAKIVCKASNDAQED